MTNAEGGVRRLTPAPYVLPPFRPRCLMVRGHAEALHEAVGADGEPVGPIIRIKPTQVISWGL